MIDKLKTQLVGNAFFQLFEFVGCEFQNFAAFNIDQVMVMFVIYLKTGKVLVEVVPLYQIQFIQQVQSPIDRCNTDRRIDAFGPLIDCFHRRMIVRALQDAQNYSPRRRHLDAGIDTPLFQTVNHAIRNFSFRWVHGRSAPVRLCSQCTANDNRSPVSDIVDQP